MEYNGHDVQVLWAIDVAMTEDFIIFSRWSSCLSTDPTQVHQRLRTAHRMFPVAPAWPVPIPLANCTKLADL